MLKIIAPNNFKHKAGDGSSTRNHYLTDLVPALQSNTGTTQCSYVLEMSVKELVFCNGISIWDSPVYEDKMMEGGIMPTLTSSPHGHVILGYKEKPIRLGNVYDEKFGQSFGGNVWDTDGLAPTLKTTAAASQQCVIQKVGDRDKENYSMHKEYVNCISANPMSDREQMIVEPMIMGMRGRDVDKPTSRKRQTPDRKFQQRLEIQKDGVSNTLTTFQKDNLVLEPITTQGKMSDVANTLLAGYERTNMTGFNNDNAVLVGGIGEKKSNGGSQYYQQDRVYSSDGVAMAHPAQIPEGSYKYMVEESTQYRIRKLTPKECFRLMGVRDEDSDKLTVSNSQKYKQAGNSIVVDVMMAIFENMFINECESNSLF